MLSEQIMVSSARQKWLSMREDARETLEVAFRDGITCPCIVPVHFCYTKQSGNAKIEFHHFRVGYATFVIALVNDYPAIIWDIKLEDGLPIYPM